MKLLKVSQLKSKISVNVLLGLLLSSALVPSKSFGTSIDWKGGYRFEFVEIDKPSLTKPSLHKSYGLNYLYLAPRVVASDGINIVSRFDIFGAQVWFRSLVDILRTGC